MNQTFHATTILSIRRGDSVAIAGDGQVTLGDVVAKADAVKVRRLEKVGSGVRGWVRGWWV